MTAFVQEVTRILADEVGREKRQKPIAEVGHLAPRTIFGKKWSRFAALASLVLILGLALTWYFFLRVSPEVKSHLNSGTEFLNQGLYGDAEKHFRQAMQTDRSNAEAHKGLQTIELHRLVNSDTDPVAVETEIRQFLQRHPDDPHAYLLWGDLFANSEPDTAIEHYQKAVELYPDLPEAWFSLGYVYGTHVKDYHTALAKYREAAELSPRNSRYLTNLAGMLCKLDRDQECIETYEKVIELHHYAFLTHLKLIEVYRLANQLDEGMPYARALA